MKRERGCSIFSVVSICWTALLGVMLGAGCAPEQRRTAESAIAAQALGAASSSILRDSPYSELVIEVASVPGREPDPGTMDAVVSFVNSHVNKSRGVRWVRGPSIPSVGSDGFSRDEMVSVESRSRSLQTSGGTLTIFLMFVDDHFPTDQPGARVMGYSYRATSLAIFKDTIRGEAAPGEVGLVERTVISHELGHLMGLVNLGAPMENNHYDHVDNTGHCSNPRCLMNFSFDTARLGAMFGPSGPQLDSNCLGDLRAAGGR